MEDCIMKKIINGKTDYCGKTARIYCTITDNDGYISITGDVIPYRCKTAHLMGCIHDEIAKAFPKLKKYLWLHLVKLDGSVIYEVENTLFNLINGNIEAAKNCLGCATDEELQKLDSLATYGIHKKTNHGCDGVWFSASKDGEELFAKEVEKLGLKQRRLAAIKEFYAFLENYPK